MGKTGFDKATAKMFGSFSSGGVKIAQPGAGERMSKEERESMREAVKAAEQQEEKEHRAEERRQVLKDLADMNLLSKEGARERGERPSVQQQPQAAAEAPTQQRGRPPKNPEVKEYVLMNFRVPVDYRQKLKVMAAEQDKSVLELFEEAMTLLFQKYNS